MWLTAYVFVAVHPTERNKPREFTDEGILC